jgi:hypothetical protein
MSDSVSPTTIQSPPENGWLLLFVQSDQEAHVAEQLRAAGLEVDDWVQSMTRRLSRQLRHVDNGTQRSIELLMACSAPPAQGIDCRTQLL